MTRICLTSPPPRREALRSVAASMAGMPFDLLPTTAMVFAAGLGQRMRPVTDRVPKPLIRVAGKPLIDHTLDRLAEAGVSRAIVNVHYLADAIEAHLAARLPPPEIILSDEREELLDQGGGISKVLADFGSAPFLICNTDAFWIEGPRSNLARLGRAWDPDKMDVLLVVASAVASIGIDWAGDFTMDSEGRLAKRGERGVVPFVYAGVGIMKPELFAADPRRIFPLAPYFFDAAEKGRLYGMRLDGQWIHVGTPDAIAEAERAVARSLR
jgi:MurNAc alpha-1-phosphate uridylyltransferase